MAIKNAILRFLKAAGAYTDKGLLNFPEAAYLMDKTSSDTNAMSNLRPNAGPNDIITTNAVFLNAILNHVYATGQAPSPKSYFTVAMVGDERWASEQVVDIGATTKAVVATLSTQGRFNAVVLTDTTAGISGQSYPNIGNQINRPDLSLFPMDGVIGMVLSFLCKTHSRTTLDMMVLSDSLEIAGNGGTEKLDAMSPEAENAIFRISDSLYWALETEKIKTPAPGGNIDLLPVNEVKNGMLRAESFIGPRPTFLFGVNTQSAQNTNAVTFGQAKAIFADWRAARNWTATDRQFIPQFDEDYKVMPEAVQLARLFVKTHNNKRPMVNFLWRGITSYGKSTGVELMAALLDMPLLRITCHTDMETVSFLSEFVPDSGKCVAGELPSFDEIANDPESAYLTLTGTELPNVSSQECLEAYAAAVEARARETATARYKIVESNFITALRKGYICEVQEISRIRDPGVLVGLNEYDRPGARIPLVDGSFATRHPDAMVVYTDNVGLVSCRPVDPSVLRRMAYVIDSYDSATCSATSLLR